MTDSRTSELDFNPEALHRKYLEERDKRLRLDGPRASTRRPSASSRRTGKTPTRRRTSLVTR